MTVFKVLAYVGLFVWLSHPAPAREKVMPKSSQLLAHSRKYLNPLQIFRIAQEFVSCGNPIYNTLRNRHFDTCTSILLPMVFFH